ncbi:MAG: hypothetical protein V7749_06215 [Cocleimonas sp.]
MGTRINGFPLIQIGNDTIFEILQTEPTVIPSETDENTGELKILPRESDTTHLA